MTSRFLLLLAMSAMFATTACAERLSIPPPDGVTPDQAVQITQTVAQAMSTTQTVWLSQKSGRCRDFEDCGPAVSDDRWVWAVVFHGNFQQGGGSAALSPLPIRYSLVVFIDYRNGEFIQAVIPRSYSTDY